MSEFDEIDSMKYGKERTEKLIEFYKEKTKINSWLTNSFKNCIIKFKDRTEYRQNGLYHRLNGPAIDFENEKLDEYYYRGKKFEDKKSWEKASIKELRRIKIKRLNKKEDSN